jgi:hypothetical protein
LHAEPVSRLEQHLPREEVQLLQQGPTLRHQQNLVTGSWREQHLAHEQLQQPQQGASLQEAHQLQQASLQQQWMAPPDEPTIAPEEKVVCVQRQHARLVDERRLITMQPLQDAERQQRGTRLEVETCLWQEKPQKLERASPARCHVDVYEPLSPYSTAVITPCDDAVAPFRGSATAKCAPALPSSFQTLPLSPLIMPFPAELPTTPCQGSARTEFWGTPIHRISDFTLEIDPSEYQQRTRGAAPSSPSNIIWEVSSESTWCELDPLEPSTAPPEPGNEPAATWGNAPHGAPAPCTQSRCSEDFVPFACPRTRPPPGVTGTMPPDPDLAPLVSDERRVFISAPKPTPAIVDLTQFAAPGVHGTQSAPRLPAPPAAVAAPPLPARNSSPCLARHWANTSCGWPGRSRGSVAHPVILAPISEQPARGF